MGNRLSAAAAVAAIFLAISIALFVEDTMIVVAIILLVLTALTLLSSVAYKIPVLDRLPVVGAPRVTVRYTIGDDPVLRVPVGARSILRVGVRNDGPGTVKDSRINFLVPETIAFEKVDPSGAPDGKGAIMSATPELAGHSSPYWALRGESFYPESTLVEFAVTPSVAGRFPVRFKLASESLRREVVADAVLECYVP